MKPATVKIVQLYKDFGSSDYIGEAINQTQHGVQAAYLATRAKMEETVIVAALLHDIGHLLALEDPSLPTMETWGAKDHEKIGAEWLRKLGMNETVCKLVEQHVQAKRYLTCIDQSYLKKLSDASRATLEFQGGSMTIDEAASFEKNPLRREILLMRTWDEKAKEVDWQGPSFEDYTSMIDKLIG
jgi:putative nucleotidyltransferase with HDIG domain